MKSPLVSVLIPTYNRATLIEEALTSVLTQTYSNLEILIHDNHSEDDTLRRLSKYRHDPRVKVYHAPHNRGMIGAWNYLLKKSRGKYIKYLASDDLIDSSCVEREVAELEANPQVVLATCQRKFVNLATGKSKLLGFAKKSGVFNGLDYASELLTTLRENRIGEPTAVIFRRRLVSQVGLFDPQFSQYADFEYWLRLLAYGDIAYLHAPLCTFRLHGASSTSSAIADGRFIKETYRLIKKYYASPTYQKIYRLTATDCRMVRRLKTLDFLKNIKDLVMSRQLTRALRYTLALARSYF